MKKEQDKRVFDLKEVGYINLDGEFAPVAFNQKELANNLFSQAQTIEMDEFARGIHKDGKAELTEGIETELLAIVQHIYVNRRAQQAVEETLNKFKTQ